MKSYQQTRRPGRARRVVVMKRTQGEANRTALLDAIGYPVQTKLKVGSPGDSHEQEADAVAERVMTMPDATIQRKSDNGTPEDERKKKEAEQSQPKKKEEEEAVQRKETGGEATVTPAGAAAIATSRGGGEALPAGERSFFEPRLGARLGQVRIHADEQAAQLSAGLSARAFTVGKDVFFGHGEYRPGTASGRRLLAHELTHVLQQSGGEPARSEDGTAQRQIDSLALTPVAPMIMRSVIFSSTIRIAYRYLRSRDFPVSGTSIRVTADAGYPNPATCGSGGYEMELKEKGWLYDSSHGSRHFPNGVSTTQTWDGLTAGETYYLIITVPDSPMRPNVCALVGNITVEE